ncbi:MAG TPA: hypothetical protein VGM76_16960 [Lacipirellulaceae bacterium]|jgi:hypothetical protein
MNEVEWNELEQRPPLASICHYGVELCAGDEVRLWPKKSADIMDLALAGKIATIETIEQDYENQIHVAVVVNDDPGKDLGLLRQVGHRFFFSLDEIEPMSLPDNFHSR